MTRTQGKVIPTTVEIPTIEEGRTRVVPDYVV